MKLSPTHNNFDRGRIILNENIINPLRSGSIEISVGRTSIDGLGQAYIMLDKMDWVFRLKPSFVMVFPSEESINRKNAKTNATIIYPKYANKELEFDEFAKGTARLKTYFFGNEKMSRQFDLYYRFFEIGFSIDKITGLDKSIFKLNQDTKLEISSSDYVHPSIIAGKTSDIIASARVVRYN